MEFKVKTEMDDVSLVSFSFVQLIIFVGQIVSRYHKQINYYFKNDNSIVD